ncbi:MAG TPA: hypothetical protein VEX62_01705 [Candidatus Limnocylindrales bacterium]|nr:hypothetical protein [Candidatus Limnocylindrales bacterium]
MSRIVFGAWALMASVVLGGCISISPTGPAVPTVPSVPSAAAVPTQPGPGQTVQPVQTPGQQASGNLCDRVTLDEISAAAGGAPAVLAEDYDMEGQCNWDVGTRNELNLPAAFVNLRADFSNALDDARTLFPGGEDIAVADDGYWMPDLNVLTFSKGGRIFSVQIALIDSDEVDPRAVAIGIATAATPRL